LARRESFSRSGSAADVSPPRTLTVAGLFAGIGGIERGLNLAGHEARLLCEIDPAARRVLEERFADVPLIDDVRHVESLSGVELLAAGFPCQDLSQAGRTAGIGGSQSGLVEEVFRLIGSTSRGPRWLFLENVPFMLQLDRGEAMRYLTGRLAELGFRWAYRVVDSRAFGLPQRRRRVLLLASKDEDPREVLFTEDAGEPVPPKEEGAACGFYWTEGLRGLGWALDAVPTLKGGSTIGIPSPPAIWMPNGAIVVPDIRDAERLQGFHPDWTASAEAPAGKRRGPRWKLVGNAVSVPVARWVGERLRDLRSPVHRSERQLVPTDRWPTAAWGDGDGAWAADLSAWPRHDPAFPLADFLEYPTEPLSARASKGFLRRARMGNLRFPDGFIADVELHRASMAGERVTGLRARGQRHPGAWKGD
jgi:DNA (cytosine-5)-methyltransferase 1